MHAVAPSACPNCGAALAGESAPAFCPRCGQETALHEPTLAEFAHEFIGHYMAVEGTLWPTLRLLIGAPGRLTREYFAGRRRRYVLPLRLYLSASFIFFLVVKVFGAASDLQLVIAPAIDVHGQPITASSDPARYAAALREMHACAELPGHCSWFEARMAGLGLKADTFSAHPEEVVQRAVGLAPYAVFVLLPLFAAIVMLAERSRRMNYGAHFVFGLHTHAAWFLLLTLLALLPGGVAAVGLLALPLYVGLSMHVVYGGPWWDTVWRGLVVAVLYGLALCAALLALSLGSVAMA